MTKLFLVAGEASGDLHGGLLAQALREIDPSVEVVGVGGERMGEAGVRLLARSEEMGVTGFWEVIRHLPRLRRLLGRLGDDLARERPDAFIPIDYPDFNLRLAARARAAGVPVLYYISPQVWAWRSGRIKSLKRLVRRMIVIFPFEEQIYRRAGIPVSYVGHPLVDRIQPSIERGAMRADLSVSEEEILVALLPGSRRSEVERILPTLLETRRRLAGEGKIRWVLALAPGLRGDDLPGGLAAEDRIDVRAGKTLEILNACDLAVMASGTATMEAALLGVPMIVVYRMHPVTWWLAKRLVRVPHVAMANLLAGERVVPEFLQGEADPRTLSAEVLRWARDPELRLRTRERLMEAAARLGPGGAVQRAAQVILGEVGRK